MSELSPTGTEAERPARVGGLVHLLERGEDWLVQRALHYARCRGYTRYTPTLEEAWRKVVRGLTASVRAGLEHHDEAPELGPHMDLASDPMGVFAVRQARSHQERGVSLPMFLGLFKYLRRAYQDLVAQHVHASPRLGEVQSDLRRIFDFMEIAICDAWSLRSEPEVLEALQQRSREITNEKNAYLTVFESLSQPAFMLDTRGRIRNINHQAVRMLGGLDRPGGVYYAQDEEDRSGPQERELTEEGAATGAPEALVGVHIRQVVPFLPPIDGLLSSVSPERSELEIRGPTPQGLRDFQVLISPMLDLSSRLLGAVVLFQDVTERHELESHLRFLATTDALTGVANRRSLLRCAEHEFRRARRYGRPLAMLLLDLDHFKKVNDTWGHFAGDEALKALCGVLLEGLRGSDMLGRLGGEEFAVLLPETSVQDACGTGERFRQLVEDLRVDWHGHQIRLTVSIGVAILEASDPDIYALMRRADLALYTAKDVGRNRVVLCADQPAAADLVGEQVDFVLDDV